VPDRGRRRLARAAVTAATTAYLANCLLGSGVAGGWIRTGRFRWVHHALYVNTVALTSAAVSSVGWSSNRAGWLLLPAAIPLTVIPSVAVRTGRHPAVALSAAPFFVSSLIYAWWGS
jgi:hypothetical protein